MTNALRVTLLGYEKNNNWTGLLHYVINGNNAQVKEEINYLPNIAFNYNPNLETLVLSIPESTSELIKGQRDRNKLNYVCGLIVENWDNLFESKELASIDKYLEKKFSENLIDKENLYLSTIQPYFSANDYGSERDYGTKKSTVWQFEKTRKVANRSQK